MPELPGAGVTMSIRNGLIDELLSGKYLATAMCQGELLGKLKRALLNRLIAVKFGHYLMPNFHTLMEKA